MESNISLMSSVLFVLESEDNNVNLKNNNPNSSKHSESRENPNFLNKEDDPDSSSKHLESSVLMFGVRAPRARFDKLMSFG